MPTVLITGAARGIGKTIATQLAADGWDVVAGVRNPDDWQRLRAEIPHVTPITLDVTNENHVAALADSLPERLDAVVNNAGVVVAGPIEAITVDDLRRQLDVNVVGQLAVTQAVLPRLRASRGRVVFISSLNGRDSFPLMGACSASKFALEAAADALRIELTPWGIAVVLVEPAQTDTDMWRTADTVVAETEAAMPADNRELYQRHVAGMKRVVTASQKMAVPPARVAAVVAEALTARRPRARYVVGWGPKLQLALLSGLPTRVRDRVLRAVAKQPG